MPAYATPPPSHVRLVTLYLANARLTQYHVTLHSSSPTNMRRRRETSIIIFCRATKPRILRLLSRRLLWKCFEPSETGVNRTGSKYVLFHLRRETVGVLALPGPHVPHHLLVVVVVVVVVWPVSGRTRECAGEKAGTVCSRGGEVRGVNMAKTVFFRRHKTPSRDPRRLLQRAILIRRR